jgi:hypothetical protein
MERSMHGVFLRTFLVLAVGAPAVSAQNECLKDYRMPAVGRWAEYQGRFDANKPPHIMRYAVVGEENRGGTPMKWLEMRWEGENKDKNMIYQMLTPGNPAEMDQVQEIIVKAGDKPAMKMSGMLVGMVRGQAGKQSAFSNLCEGVTLVGEESVTVPAGTFKALRFHNAKEGGDAWVVPDLPFHLVKFKGKDNEISLLKTGEGAMSSITEKPQEMPGSSK